MQTPNPEQPPEEVFNAAGEKVDSAMDTILSGDLQAIQSLVVNDMLPAIIPAAIGLGVIFLGYLAAKYISRIVSRPVCDRVDETLGRFAGNMIFYAIFLGVLVAVASKLGAPLGGMAALLAGASFAIGLAFQGTLSNFAAGVLMMVFRPFKVGDFIHAGGVSGVVNEIDLFNTTLDTTDNRRIIVPNSAISGGTIENVSYHPHRRIEVVVGVDYSADLDTTRDALQRAIDALASKMISGKDRGSAVVLANLGDSAVEWKVRMWVAASDYWPMTEALTGEVKRELDAKKIGIPFPQMDIHVNRVDAAEVPSRQRPRVRPTARTDENATSFPFAS